MFVKIVESESENPLDERFYVVHCESAMIRKVYFGADEDIQSWYSLRDEMNVEAGYEKYKRPYFVFGRPEDDIVRKNTKVIFIELDDRKLVALNAKAFIIGDDGKTIDRV